jgi:hypothetical protein
VWARTVPKDPTVDSSSEESRMLVLRPSYPDCRLWNPKASGSASFLEPIKYTAVRTAQFEIQLELTDLPGQSTSLTPQLSFVPHATEKAALKVARAKLWTNDKYMQLTPGTKAMIQGAIVVARVAVRAAVRVSAAGGKTRRSPREAFGSAGAQTPCWVGPGAAWPPIGCRSTAALLTYYRRRARRAMISDQEWRTVALQAHQTGEHER